MAVVVGRAVVAGMGGGGAAKRGEAGGGAAGGGLCFTPDAGGWNWGADIRPPYS
ncbi:MAG: hypothetical protein V9E98_12225 [Candidatus Nanopelagicales bacterium]